MNIRYPSRLCQRQKAYLSERSGPMDNNKHASIDLLPAHFFIIKIILFSSMTTNTVTTLTNVYVIYYLQMYRKNGKKSQTQKN